MKFCKDCKWIEPAPGFPLAEALCKNPLTQPAPSFNLVTGEPVPVRRSCAAARLFGEEPYGCGPQGRLWEPREVAA
jgi:hypothetical protein